MHLESHIDYHYSQVDIHIENHHFLSCNCLDSCMAEKHKDHLCEKRKSATNRSRYSNDYLTIFTSLTTISRWTLTSESTIIAWKTLTTIQAWVFSTWISYEKNTVYYIFTTTTICSHLKTCYTRTVFTT